MWGRSLGRSGEHAEPQVTNPCGVCRGLVRTCGAEMTAMVDGDGTAGIAGVKDLLPYPWLRATGME
jgi:cytidine deaminase